MRELRIVNTELWRAAQDARSICEALPLVQRRRPKHFFSGLALYGECGGAYAIISRKWMGCTRAREASTSSNRATIALGEPQAPVLAELEDRL